MTVSSKRLFDIFPDVDDDPNDLDGETAKVQRKARKDAISMRKRALDSIAEDSDE